MTDHADDAAARAVSREFPLFLSRERDSMPSEIQPPPLPQPAFGMRLIFALRRCSGFCRELLGVRVSTVSSGVAAILMSLASAGHFVNQERPPRTPPQPQPAHSIRSEVTSALAAAAEIETRLAYAPRLADVVMAPPALQETIVNTRDPDPVGLLILRNLPDNATLSDGASAGPGSWALAAGDPGSLNASLGEGFGEPVTVDVELISRSGQQLGALQLRLQKDPPNREAKEAAEDDQKPSKRQRRAQVRSQDERLAQAPRGHRKHAKSRDADEAGGSVEGANAANAAGEAGNEKKEGTIAKLLSWFKSSPTKAASGTAADDGEPQTGSAMRRGLGMKPQD